LAQNAIERKWKAPYESSRGEELKSGVFFCVLTTPSAEIFAIVADSTADGYSLGTKEQTFRSQMMLLLPPTEHTMHIHPELGFKTP
jgi:hypothetical protein